MNPYDESEPEQETLTVAEVARVLRMHRTSVYDQIKRGTFPVRVLKVGGILRIPKDAFDRYFAGELEPTA